MQEPLQIEVSRPYKPLFGRLAKTLGSQRLRLALARLLYRLKVEGTDSIPLQAGCLVTFNHVSDVADSMVYLAVQYRRPDVSLFTWGFNGATMSRLFRNHGLGRDMNSLFLTDLRPELNVSELLRARQTLLDGGCVAITPEGETTWDGRLQSPLLPGAAWLALHTAVPVIPIVSMGGYDIQPLWRREKFHWTGRVRLRVGQPFRLSEQPLPHVSTAQVAAASQSIWQAMADLLSN